VGVPVLDVQEQLMRAPAAAMIVLRRMKIRRHRTRNSRARAAARKPCMTIVPTLYGAVIEEDLNSFGQPHCSGGMLACDASGIPEANARVRVAFTHVPQITIPAANAIWLAAAGRNGASTAVLPVLLEPAG
jgi:hypothetical protein